MTVEEMIRDVNSLPVQAQQKIADFIESMKAEYVVDTQNDKQTFKHGIEAGFGMFKVDKVLTDDDIDNAIAQAMQEKFERINNQ